MKIVIGLLVVLLFSPFTCDFEEGFKGIRVFETSRTQVEKLLASPFEERDYRVFYDTKDYLVSVIYSADPCSAPETIRGGYKVKRDTVLAYDMVPRGSITLRSLGIRSDRYERVEDPHLIGLVMYSDRLGGIRISTRKVNEEEEVRHIYFDRPAAKEEIFRCECKDAEGAKLAPR